MNFDEITPMLEIIYGLAMFAVILFPKQYFPRVNRGKPSNREQAVKVMLIASLVQFVPSFIGNMFDVPAIIYLFHAIAGAVFGAGLRFAFDYASDNSQEQVR